KESLFIINGTSPSGFREVIKTQNGVSTQLASTNDPFLQRYSSTATYFKNKMYIVSGWEGYGPNIGCTADVWHSTTGRGWLPDTLDAPWSATSTTAKDPGNGRLEHTLTVFDDGSGPALFLIGGGYCKTGGIASDVWKSVDGANWALVTAGDPVLGSRLGHTAVVYNNRLYVMGGFTQQNGYQNDSVWTDDGAHWHVVPQNQRVWGPRGDHSSFVYKGKLWVIGGYSINSGPFSLWVDPAATASIPPLYYNDVWSFDGTAWQEVAASTPWSGRRGAITKVLNGLIYQIGGSANQGVAGTVSDTWVSQNAVNWTHVGDLTYNSNPLSVVESMAVVTPYNFGNGLGGNPPTITSTQFPLTGIYNQIAPIPIAQTGLVFRSVVTSSLLTDTWFTYDQMSTWNPMSLHQKTVVTLNSISGLQQILQTGLLPDTTYSYEAVATNSIGMTKSTFYGTTSGCNNTVTPLVKFKYPPGGDFYAAGQNITLAWESCNISATASLKLVVTPLGAGGGTVTTIPNSGSANITLPSIPGPYRIQIIDPLPWQSLGITDIYLQ
ncbi:MAG: hypothetical protein RL641_552, partial [Candidatus Parcubacteria bacterium]